MSRNGGWSRCDHDLNFLADPAIMDAVVRLGLRAAVAYIAVRDASWAAGKRVTLRDAIRRLPRIYDMGDTDELEAVLIEAGLLDPDGGIRASSWAAWYMTAQERREARAAAGRYGNTVRWGTDRNAIAMRSGRDPQPTNHPSNHPSSRAGVPARGTVHEGPKNDGGPSSFREIMAKLNGETAEKKEATE